MPLAFVLINAEIGAEEAVLKKLSKSSNITEAHIVYGVYDIVAKVQAESLSKLKEVVTWQIRRIDNVRLTLTMIVTESS